MVLTPSLQKVKFANLKFQLTESQKKVFSSILEDIFYLENTLQTVEDNSLIHLARISIIFNYISLETLRNFYCEKLLLCRTNLEYLKIFHDP